MLTKYGILDDFGSVSRWTYDKPEGRGYVVVSVPKQERSSAYEIAVKRVGYSEF